MKTNEALKLIDNEAFLEKIYNFSYNRCSTSYEAEDLCSDIILSVIQAIQKQDNVDNFYAFVWTVARRVYADYAEKRSKQSCIKNIEEFENLLVAKENEIDAFVEELDCIEKVRKVFSEISFLSKIYREVMVMYYIDDMSIKDIAKRLSISENTVKQRLFSARNIVRKEVESMTNRNLSLKPIDFCFFGTGNPCYNDPAEKATRSLSKNIIYACKEKARTAKELSDELSVPMPYIEEELEIQCKGQNGKYGMLRSFDNGKYGINILVADYDEWVEASSFYEKYLPQICSLLREGMETNREKILSFPFLNKQTDLKFLLWSLISNTVWSICSDVGEQIKEKYFADVTISVRPYTLSAVACNSEFEKNELYNNYGCDGINAKSIAGYSSIHMRNIYGKRVRAHFRCGHNISHDSQLLLLISSIGGLNITELDEQTKEVAAKCIECGYLRKNKDIIEPNIVVFNSEHEKEFEDLSYVLCDNIKGITNKISDELGAYIKKKIPKHLVGDFKFYNSLIASPGLLTKVIDECIKEGLLNDPHEKLCGEGVVMIVSR